jgi:ferredoxin--NADP+ reductase
VRGGVAPDHPKIKSVTGVYERIASFPGFRFYGNVTFGSDLTWADMVEHYHAVIFAVGAQSDRKLDIPGEDLPGSHGATEFVAWYNGHPDYRHLDFDLSQESAVVIGVGNVAMDVARILARTGDELRGTDIADYALEALANSSVKTITIVGRRGPAQAKFTNPEVREMGELMDVDVIVAPQEVALDPLSQATIDAGEDKVAVKNVECLTRYANTPTRGKSKRVVFRFLASPVEITGRGRVEAVKLVKNTLYRDDRGALRPRATDQFEIIPAGLVFRSVGYRGTALPGVPFHEPWGTIPHKKGRVLTRLEGGEAVVGSYVTGWIKRGPSGIIGTNKPDSVETVESLLEDLRGGKVLEPARPEREALEALLRGRGIRYVTFGEWLILDRIEVERGEAIGRPRLKFTDVGEMLEVLESHTDSAHPGPAG